MDFSIPFKNINIRPLSPKDGQQMKQFEDNLLTEDLFISRKIARNSKQWKSMVENMSQDIENHCGVVLVAVKDDQIVGQSQIFLHSQKSIHIGEFGILLGKNFRSQGFGTKLAQLVIQLAFEQLRSLECVNLGVFANNNPALALYKKLGFKEVANIPKKFKHNDQYSNEIIMQLWLKK